MVIGVVVPLAHQASIAKLTLTSVIVIPVAMAHPASMASINTHVNACLATQDCIAKRISMSVHRIPVLMVAFVSIS